MTARVLPRRIQLQRTKGWRMPAGAISVARPTRWGIPFVAGQEASVAAQGTDGLWYDFSCRLTLTQAIELYRTHLEASLVGDGLTHPEDLDDLAEIRHALESLRGHDLACWCPPESPCHADVLLDLANRL